MQEIWNWISQYWGYGLIAFLFTTGLVSISPLKLDPWGWIFKKIGKIANEETNKNIKDLHSEVNHVQAELEAHIEQNYKNEALNCRRRILRFVDYMNNGMNHSDESFDQILSDITDYEVYCNTHENFENKKAELAIQCINDAYQARMIAKQQASQNVQDN